MAEDLRPHRVTSVSLYPGLVLTESVTANLEHFADQPNRRPPCSSVGSSLPSPRTRTSCACPAGGWWRPRSAAYGVTDEDGHRPRSNRPQILGQAVSDQP